MAAKLRSKGTSLSMSIGGTYTAVPSLISLTISGEKTGKYESTTLDGGYYKTFAATGYVEPCSLSAQVFWDPDDSVHSAIKAKFANPTLTTFPTNFKVTYTNDTPTSEIYSVTCFGIDRDIQKDNAVVATITLETSGAPT